MANRTNGTTDAISQHRYFMEVARLVKQRSEDPRCKVGACIAKDGKFVGEGYNYMPRNRSDLFPVWADKEMKNVYVCHAELNAIVNSKRTDFTGCKMYVTRIPCSNCAKLLVQYQIKEVYYEMDKDDAFTRDLFEKLEPQGFTLRFYGDGSEQ